MNPDISVIVPVFNEEPCLQETYEALTAELSKLDLVYELIFVNDGSTDRSEEIISELKQRDERVMLFSFSRNFGHEAASSCGFAHCRGRAAILIDADLQDPPELIAEMVKKWKEGYEIVAGRRKTREGETLVKKVTSYVFYRVMNLFSEVSLPRDVGDFRLVDRKVIDNFNNMTEKNRFVRGLFPWLGFNQYFLEYDRKPRAGGRSKYNYFRLLFLSFDAISSFSLAPLRMAVLMGFLVTIFSAIAVFHIVFQKLVFGIDIPGYAFLTTGVFFLGGVQVFFLGVIGEYVGKIYKEAQGRPLYILKNGDPEE